MRYFALFLFAAALTCAQTIATYDFDPAGNRSAGPVVSVQGDRRTERIQSLNGRSVPLESVEERVISDNGTSKVIERITRRFDPNGHVAETERVSEEQIKSRDGVNTVRAATYRTDVNGNMQLAERSVTETRKSGTAQTSEVVIERPSMDGSMQTAEKRVIVDDRMPARDSLSTVVYRRSDDGRFYEAVKETSETQISAGRSIENSARYAVGTSGRLELYEQTVKTTVKKDGTESTVVDVYASEVPGNANASGDRTPKLKQQQLIERRSSNGQVDEIVSIRQPSVSDPDRLGPARKIKETVCTGKCD